MSLLSSPDRHRCKEAKAMETLDYLQDHLQALGAEVTGGKMFGAPCLKINGNVFLTRMEEGLVYKLDEVAREEVLEVAGASHFVPAHSGRAMREWIHIPLGIQADHKRLAERALAFVSTLPAK